MDSCIKTLHLKHFILNLYRMELLMATFCLHVAGKSKRGSGGGLGGRIETQRTSADSTQAPKNLSLRMPPHTSKLQVRDGCLCSKLSFEA